MRDMRPEERPTHLAVVFDKSEKTFRSDMYAEYKANRSAPPDDLIPQFAYIREAVRAFDLPCLEQAGFEADDLIATYVRQACDAGARATIVSSDKDLMQLITDCVMMYDTMKDKRIGIPEVMEKFGVPPEKVIEVQALIGDSTDNVPGVPGIGVKTAAQLICEYGDLETLLARAGEIKQQKRRETLIDNAENARLSKKLVTLDDKVKLDVPIDDLAVHEPDYKLLIAFLKAMEFSTLTRRVAEFSGIDAAEIDADETMRGGSASAFSAAGADSSLALGEGGRGVATSTKSRLPLSPSLPLKGGGSIPSKGRGHCSCGRCHQPAGAGQGPAGGGAQQQGRSFALRDRAHVAAIAGMDRARDRPRHDRHRHPDLEHRSDADDACVASRSRLAPTRPATCRSRTGRAGMSVAADYLPADWRPISSAKSVALGALKPLLEDREHPQDRAELQVRLADFCPARHRGCAVRRHAVDLLRAGCRPRRP